MSKLTIHRTLLAVCVVGTTLGAGAALAVRADASSGAPPRQFAVPAATPIPTALPAQPHIAPHALAPAATATNAHCGQTITASLTLNGDLECSGSGLIVSGTSVVLNLNGHYVASVITSTSYGVRLTGKSETVENGLVTGFSIGVAADGTTDTVSNVRATYNDTVGILDRGTGDKITNCVASWNNNEGIEAVGPGAALAGDHELSTVAGPGLYLGAQHQTVTGNVANGNHTVGIRDFGFGTTLTKNTADFNNQDGIQTGDVAVIDGGGNMAKGNDYATGMALEQCAGVVCS